MKLLTPLVLSTCAIFASAQVKHGTIGMGINMYHPWCCTACSDVLSPLFLNCTTFDEEVHHGHGMVKRMAGMEGPMGTTSADCRMADQPWLQTFSHCIKTHCDAEGVTADKQEQYWQTNAAEGMPVPALLEALPAQAPSMALTDDAEWLNETMLVHEEKWTIDRLTIMEFEKVENDHSIFSMVVMIVTVAMSIIAGLWLLLTSSSKSTLFNKVRAYFTLPALLGGRQSEALPWNIGYMPSRSTSTIIFIYILLNVVFNCVRFQSIQPNSWYTSKNQEFAAYVGNRAGVLSFANMALAMLFSARNNPLSYISGWTPTTFITLHRWAARVSIIQAVIHSIAYTADYVSYMDPPMFYDEAKVPYFWWGIIATVAMSLMAGLSILPLRRMAYEVFLVLHIALAILSLVGCWYHIGLRFSKKWGYEVWLYLAFAFWAYDRFLRFARLIFHSFLGGTSHGQVEAIPGVDNIISLKLYPSRAFKAAPGQHTFVYFPSLGRFWENHPFTIASWGVDRVEDSEKVVSERASLSSKQQSKEARVTTGEEITSENSSMTGKGPNKEIRITTKSISSTQPLYLEQFYVKCLFRVHSGTTTKLQRRLINNPASTILCEGPYGGHSPAVRSVLRNAEHILVIAGGIGITFAAAYAKQFADETTSTSLAVAKLMPSCKRLHLAWTVREQGLLDYARRELLPPAANTGGRALEYTFHVTGTPATKEAGARRMDITATLDSMLVKNSKIVVLVCGPGGLADDVRRQIVQANKRGFDVEMLEESFAW